jgi:hypothetical protein
MSSTKRKAPDSGMSVDKRPRISSDDSEILEFEESDALIESKLKIFPIDDLEFFILNDNGYVPCKPENANAIKKDGIIYKQVGRGFDLTFASLTCLFIRMREGFKYYGTPTAKDNHKGRTYVKITDDNGQTMFSQALKFASLAWGKLTPAAKLGTAGMPLREFGSAFQVDHIDKDKTNNVVSNGMIMTKKEHHKKTTRSAESIARAAMSQSAPCTMTVFVSKGQPLLDSERNPIVKNYPHRKEVKDDYKLTSNDIAHSIKNEDMPARNSLVKIKYEGRDCWAQFSWYDLPDLEGEIWKRLTAADHDTLEVPIPPLTEYWVSSMERFKFVVKSTKNARIRDFRGEKRPSINLMKMALLFYRVVALVFHRKQMNEYIADQYLKTGIVWTFAPGQYQLEVDHIDFDPKNNYANNLQFLTPEENKQRSNSRPCRIWEVNSDTKTKYPSLTAAAKAMGYKSTTTAHRILKNNTHKKWRGEYI